MQPGNSDAIARESQRRMADEILGAGLSAVDPFRAVCATLKRDGDKLALAGRHYDLSQFQRIFVIGAGKAGAPMAAALEEVLGTRITKGLVNIRRGSTSLGRVIHINEAGHPVPDERGFAGTREIVRTLQSAGADDLVICVISGGGSALLELPQEPITLADLQSLTQALLASGATINEMNTIRKHISQVKGGRLAQTARPATVISLILSDVVGNPLDIIASGPTVPDTSTYDDAWQIILKYGLESSLPNSVRDVLQSGLQGKQPETPKPGDPLFDKVQNVIIGSNYLAAKASDEAAKALGFNTLLLSTYIEGEAREVGKALAAIAKEIRASGHPLKAPACVIAGGETTVTIRGSGKGGRNTELALSAAISLAGIKDVLVFSAATDGSDGPTDASGAYGFGDTLERAGALGLRAADYLANNDSYNFFSKLGDLAKSGPTNTNVNDLIFIFTF